MQRASAGKPDLVDAGAYGCLDIFAFSRPRITLPLAPFRNHRHPLAASRNRNIFHQISRFGARHLRRNLNALSQQLFRKSPSYSR
jgi:hypothetical protein